MDILNYIPFGQENSITRQDLARAVRTTDREVREMISQARRDEPILCFGKGYFRPTDEEKHLVNKWLKQETNRAKSIFWSSKGAKNFIRTVG